MQARRTGRRLSLEHELPLIMTGVFASGILAMLALTYLILTGRAETIVRDRLSHAVRALAGDAEAAMTERAASVRAVARDPRVSAALSDRTTETLAAARAALDTLVTSTAVLPAELWDASGKVVASVGPTIPDSLRTPIPSVSNNDSTVFSKIRPYNGGFVFWLYHPVIAKGSRAGWVALGRRVGGRKDAEQNIREMLREDVHFNLANRDGTVWAAAPGTPTAAPMRRAVTKRGMLYERGQGVMLAEETQLRGTPWFMVLEVPRDSIYARPLRTVRLLGWLCLGLLILGAAALWLVSRRITKPISDLAAQAESFAQPADHATVVMQHNELGRLSAAFAEMKRRVTAAQQELEERVAQSDKAARDLARTNEQLRAAIDEADRATRAKGDFLAMMSHELRTPLNAIGGYSDLIEMGVHGPVTDAQRIALKRLARSKAHLLALIEQVLDFARMNAGHVHYSIEDVDVHQLVSSLDPLIVPQLEQRRISFAHTRCDQDIIARADPEKLRQVLLNLIGNSIKFTPDGGSIWVECGRDARYARVRVHDSGIGIPHDRLDVIFEPFVQGERALSRPTEGVGLGLAISRDLARGMGGQISVESEPGKGSTFTVILPLSRRPQAIAAAPTPHADVGATV